MGVLSVSSRLATAALVGLVAVDVVLVGVALRSNHPSGIDTSAVSSPSFSTPAPDSATPSSSATSPASTSSTSSPTATKTLPPAPLKIMLVAIDDRRAWRVHAGSCSAGGATLASTDDGGKTWASVKAPLRTIVRLRPRGSQTAFVIGAGAGSGCVAELRRTTDGGGTWGSANDVGGAWFRDPKNPRLVGAPGSSTSEPCGRQPVLDLAVVSTDVARVLCADGRVRSTTSTGSSWSGSGRFAGAVALAVPSARPEQTYVVRVGAPDCAGIQIRRIDRNVAISCIATPAPRNPGQIALSVVDGGGWLAVGDTTRRSTDGLATWRQS